MKRAFNFRFVCDIPAEAKVAVVRTAQGETFAMCEPGQPAKLFDFEAGRFEEVKILADVPLMAVR